MSEPIVIVAYVSYIECPHCSAPAMGFLNDPRGGTYKCDSCGEDFHVPLEAKIDFG